MVALPSCLPASDGWVNERSCAAERCERFSGSGKPSDELTAPVAGHDGGEPDSVGKVIVNGRWGLIMKLRNHESGEAQPSEQCHVVSDFSLKSSKSTYQCEADEQR